MVGRRIGCQQGLAAIFYSTKVAPRYHIDDNLSRILCSYLPTGPPISNISHGRYRYIPEVTAIVIPYTSGIYIRWIYGGNFFYLIPCLHQFRGHSWFPIQQIIVKFILPGSTRFGALP